MPFIVFIRTTIICQQSFWWCIRTVAQCIVDIVTSYQKIIFTTQFDQLFAYFYNEKIFVNSKQENLTLFQVHLQNIINRWDCEKLEWCSTFPKTFSSLTQIYIPMSASLKLQHQLRLWLMELKVYET